MIPFAIKVERFAATHPQQAFWVLAIQGKRFLIAVDGKFEWVKMEDAVFHGMVKPDAPKPVVPVQAQGSGPSLVLPRRGPNGAMG